MTAYLIVRAVVEPEFREGFDQWYETEHLSDAKTAFGVAVAERGWSAIDPAMHSAIYEFEDLQAAQDMVASDAMRVLVDDFDKAWPAGVTRTREIIDIVQRL